MGWHWTYGAADGSAAALLLGLTGLAIGMAVTEADGAEDGSKDGIWYIWFSVLFAPMGCLLRWQLSGLNGRTGWFPLGTFFANMLACCVDYGLEVVMLRVPLTPLQRAVVLGVVTGTDGCLSTVSTWVVELQTLSLRPALMTRAYVYGASSIVCGVVFGLLIYGVPYWTD
uniref:Fluoride ion transporter CrcB n=1 Tax=Chlamydomonas euryale TaxID=1486919 RepID=A0A6U2FYI1_9CHLO